MEKCDKNNKKMVKNVDYQSVLKIIFGILLIIVYVFIAYNVYEIYDELDEEQDVVEQHKIETLLVDIEEPIIDITQKDTQQSEKKESELVSLGEFKLTSYCNCYICCGKWAIDRPKDKYGNEIVYGAIGEQLKEGYSIAVDPDVIPYGTEVVINGHTYKAQDCGGAIKGKRIDIYVEDHQKALEFGVQYAELFVK